MINSEISAYFGDDPSPTTHIIILAVLLICFFCTHLVVCIHICHILAHQWPSHADSAYDIPRGRNLIKTDM